MSKPFKFKLPATSANLGIGFDSIGIAVNKFLEIEAIPYDDWLVKFNSPELAVLPTDEENLVIQIAQQIARDYHCELPPLQITMTSNIPLTHGLGSSATAIVAGIELANHFCELNLSVFDKVRLGSSVEGHPDNIGPCVTGGLFIGYYQPKTDYQAEELIYQVLNLEDVALIVSVPPYDISTEEARKALPQTYSRAEMAMQNAIGTLMMLAALEKDYEQMGQLMMKDLIHEPYRQKLVKEFPVIKATAKENHAYATVISGAGPTLLTLCHTKHAQTMIDELTQAAPECSHEQVMIVPH